MMSYFLIRTMDQMRHRECDILDISKLSYDLNARVNLF
jgi:hypothetical protein